jgi:PAS domain S-box-containing protein
MDDGIHPADISDLSADELWRALVSSAFDLVFAVDAGYTVLFANRSVPGWDVKEFPGRLAHELVIPEHRDDSRRLLERVFHEGKTLEIEVQDARVHRWYSCRVTPVAREGRVIAALIVASDVTEKKKAEQALRHEHDRARQYLAVAGVILVTLDRRGCVTLVNQMGCDVLGRRADEILGKDWFDNFVPERLRRSVRPVFDDLIAGRLTELPERYENPVVTCSGEERLIAWRNTVLRDDDGEIMATLSSGEDITERRRAEQQLQAAHDELERRVAERTEELARANRLLREDIAKREQVERELRESEEQFRAIADATPIPIMISRNSDGLILYGNQRLAEVAGRPLAELLGMKTPDFYYDPSQRESVLAEIQSKGYIRNREIRARMRDEDQAWILFSASPITYRGEPAMLAGLLDITKRKAYEKQLRDERRLLRRLLDLNERDRQLIAYEIHDGIVQDMTGTLMFLEAAKHAVPDEVKGATENLNHSVRLLRGSIREARRLIDGLRPPVLDEAGLVPAIENLAAELAQTAKLAVNVSHNVQFDRIAPTLEMAIFRIVQEGLNNVWQHSGADKADVSIVQEDEQIRITIRDEGTGFDPQKVRKKRYGLAGVRERARLLGGTARIESTPGAGTRIRVALPLTDVLLPQVEPLPEDE